jgi:myotubularin-related protein 9
MLSLAEVPVLVHGAEGTDSTLLVTSLAALVLDADARTIRGFESLIEREWISAGHSFWSRCNHSAFAVGGVTGPDEAPTFLLFLDCVWQVNNPNFVLVYLKVFIW